MQSAATVPHYKLLSTLLVNPENTDPLQERGIAAPTTLNICDGSSDEEY